MNSPARRPVKRNPPGAVRFVELPPLRFAGRGAAADGFALVVGPAARRCAIHSSLRSLWAGLSYLHNTDGCRRYLNG